MRKSRVIALVIASLVSSAPLAQAQSAAPGAQASRQGMRGRMAGERGRGIALRGIKLSDAEKARLKEIRAKYATEAKSLRASLKPAMQEARALRQKGDTAGARAVWQKNAGVRTQVEALRTRQQADIRAALSPENQKLFDANATKLAERRARGAKHGGRKGHKGGHRGEHKPAKQARPATNG